MTSRRLQLDSLVKERKKNGGRLGKIVDESGTKKWSVRFFPDIDPVDRKSAQLTVVDESDIPADVMHWFETGKLKDATTIASIPTPPPAPPPEKENLPISPPEKENQPTENTPGNFSVLTTPRHTRSSLDGGFPTPDSRALGAESDEETKRSDILCSTRRKSVYGRSVVKKPARSSSKKSASKKILFPAYDSDSSESYAPKDSDNESTDEEYEAIQEEDDEMIMTAELLFALDEELAEVRDRSNTLDTDDMETQHKTLKYYQKLQKARSDKARLIGKEVIVVNGSGNNKVTSKWKVIDDISDPNSITAKKRPQEEIGVIGLDFNRLADANFPLVEVLFRFWPGDAMQQLSKLNIEFRKQYPKKPSVTLKEFFVFFACLLGAAPAGYGGDRLWNPPVVRGLFPHPDLNHVMQRTRFKAIKSCFAAAFAYDWTHVPKDGEVWSPFEHLTAANDEWAKLQGLVNDFNATIQQNFSASSDKCLDESMSPFKPRQTRTGNLPHISFVKRKPKPIGTEYKCIACAESGVMLKLEIQRGERGMEDIQHVNKWGTTTACTIRLGEVVSSDGNHCDTLYGDSWFASIKSAVAVNKLHGAHFVGHVKTAHRRFPKQWLDNTMADWPGGTYMCLESCISDTDVIAIGYKYNKNKVFHFVMTRGASLTTPGDPYMSKYRSHMNNYKSREVHRPLAVSNYFGTAGKIDLHNQIRQGEIALEEHWVTADGWLRNVCTVLSMAVTNAFFASSYSFSSDSQYSQLKAKDFVSILAHQLVLFPFPETTSFGKSVLPPGQAPLQWFELLPERFVESNLTTPNPAALSDVTNSVEEESPTVGKTQLQPGQSASSQPNIVPRPIGAPGLPPDITEYHRQVKIKATDIEGKRNRPKACKMCQFHGLKQKKAPYLCVECGGYFCHDTERGRKGSVPRGCYWTHMSHIFKDSGVATQKWNSDFEKWNNERVSKCKKSDGLL